MKTRILITVVTLMLAGCHRPNKTTVSCIYLNHADAGAPQTWDVEPGVAVKAGQGLPVMVVPPRNSYTGCVTTHFFSGTGRPDVERIHCAEGDLTLAYRGTWTLTHNPTPKPHKKRAKITVIVNPPEHWSPDNPNGVICPEGRICSSHKDANGYEVNDGPIGPDGYPDHSTDPILARTLPKDSMGDETYATYYYVCKDGLPWDKNTGCSR